MTLNESALEARTTNQHRGLWYDTPVTESELQTSPTGLAPPVVPSTLIEGKYRILRHLGEGGMGIVMLAQDLALHRRVAVKIMRRELLTSERVSRRFLSEARSMARVHHPNVLGVFSTIDARRRRRRSSEGWR